MSLLWQKCTIFETKCETAFRVGSHVASLVVGQTLCCSIWICPSNQQVWPRLFSQNYRKCIFKRSLSLFAQPLSFLFPPNRFGCAVLFLSLGQRFGQPHHTCKETAYLILPGKSSVVQIMQKMKKRDVSKVFQVHVGSHTDQKSGSHGEQETSGKVCKRRKTWREVQGKASQGPPHFSQGFFWKSPCFPWQQLLNIKVRGCLRADVAFSVLMPSQITLSTSGYFWKRGNFSRSLFFFWRTCQQDNVNCFFEVHNV